MASTSSTSLDEELRLLDPRFFAEGADEVLGRLRRESPVHWFEPGRFWVVSKYDDVKDVLRTSNTFSVSYGITIGDSQRAHEVFPEGSLEPSQCPLSHPADARRILCESYNPEGAEMLLHLDPPRHVRVRRLISQAFTPRMVAGLEPWIRELATGCLDAVEAGEVTDIVDGLSVPVPLYVIAAMMGIPEEDHEAFRRWSDAVIMLGIELSPEEQGYVAGQMGEFFEYIKGVIEERRREPADDLLSRLVAADIDGEKLNQATLEALALMLLAAGNETTRNLISGAVRALAEHPDEREILVEHPEHLGTAVEEFLRWVNPIAHFARTAKAATEIRGQPIAPGDYVILLFPSANRDEDIWDRPDDLVVTRPTDPPHLAFGFGEHVCLGANLARLEAKVVLEELLLRFPNFELAGPVERVPSLLINGIESMPVRFA